ncbi:MAG: hypothetical protein JWM88_51 [Verrucomicrobia bacterium]|nr:hypothetical protein [Verrucomicrobiota bacterium]
MTICAILGGAASLRADPHAAAAEPVKQDTLVYKDGDQIKGRLKERSATEIVFLSTRFGLLHVPVADAKVILANGDDDTMAEVRARREEAEGPFTFWSLLSLRALTSQVRNFFGPWHGRFAVSSQVVSDTTDRTNDTIEAHLQRKWKKDTIQINGRYDYSETNGLVTTDIVKGDASWRHDFQSRLFASYTPSAEMNRAFSFNGLPADYVLVQQELGVGVNVFTSPKRNLRVGMAENVFDLWQIVPPESHNSKTAESVFLEADWKLPWAMTLTERGVWYYSINTGRDGWENKIELDKKLTETFTVGIRHEVRYNNPGVRVQDYTLLKLLIGIDF